MNRIFFTTLLSAALLGTTQGAQPGMFAGHEKHHHHDKMDLGKTPADMEKKCDEQIEKIKGMGDSLPPEMKEWFDYNMKLAGVESEFLKKQGKHARKHAKRCHHHLMKAEKIVHKHAKREEKLEKHKEKELDHGKMGESDKTATGPEAVK